MKQGPQDKSKIWQRRIEAAESFPGSIHNYCTARGISEASFYYWQKKIRARDKRTTLPVAQSDFLPVVVSPTATMSDENETSASRPFNEQPLMPDARWAAEFVAHLFYLSGGAR